MRVLISSDIHLDAQLIAEIQALQSSHDAFIFCGDFCNASGLKNAKSTFGQIICLTEQMHLEAFNNSLQRPSILLPGNHDPRPAYWPTRHARHGIYDLCGLKVLCLPFVPAPCGQWGYQLSYKQVQALAEKYEGKSVDLVVTHSPPSGILDYGVYEHANNTCKAVLDKLASYKAVLFGHIHECGGLSFVRSDGKLFCNAARSLISIDTEDWSATTLLTK